MPRYKANIEPAELRDGRLVVPVRFTDTETGGSFVNTFETTQPQDADWPKPLVQERLEHINKLAEFKETVEPEELLQPTKEEKEATETAASVDIAKEEYRKKYQEFMSFVSAIDKTFATEEHPDFVARKQWLTDNFTPDYLDIF